jgi:protocatechuate 3,4-dioxygenase, alpha subunit
MKGTTPSQTVGPFFRIALAHQPMNDLLIRGAIGEPIIVQGRILDGDGVPVPDAMIEIWQANAAGKYDHPEDDQEKLIDPNFDGFGRCATDGEGYYRFRTIRPGSVYGPSNRAQAPHINVSVFARGILKRLATRMYFPDEPMNERDPVLELVPKNRRATMIARRIESRAEPVFEFDIKLQGDGETIFLDI